jgi:glycosyltransferase involved in cell wall biosynthesis
MFANIDMSQVSVLIPNYNNSRWLGTCLESCLMQDYLKEIIVVDDHSNDDSWELLKTYQARYPHLIRIFQNEGKGANTARNFAFSQSTGEYIQWLDSDDSLLAGKFREQVNALKIAEADVAYSDFRLDFYENGSYQRSESKKQEAHSDFCEKILEDNWIACNAYLVRRSIAMQLAHQNGWNPLTRVGQDREYFTLAALLGARFLHVEGVYAVYNRWSDKSVSSMSFEKRLELNQLLEDRFRNIINASTTISAQRKKQYNRILDTHKVKACYYHSDITISSFINPFSIRWDLIHWKMRVVIPIVLFKKTFSLIKSNLTNAK